MELVATKPASTVLIGENYATMLKESTDRILDEIRRGISDFSGFSSIFFRLLQARVDPPLETIWFYSAARFRSIEVEKEDILGRVLRVKDLFQLLTSCSISCNGLKSVAVMCPVLFELYQVVFELWGKKLLQKAEKKALKETVGLIEGVLSYISICGCEDYGRDDALGDLVPCFAELVRVWTIDHSKGNLEISESLRVFFPLVSDEIRDGFSTGELGTGYLVGVVIVQAFLLRLCSLLQAGAGLSKLALQQELSTWATGSITAFQNCCFFEVLLRLLLEPTLPVTSLLDSKDEALLRNVLHDVVILAEYSFLDIEEETMLTSNCMKRLALRKLIVVHEATEDAREKGDHTKAISYINAFTTSSLPSILVKSDESHKPNVSTPQALLKWLLNLENRGARVFDNDTLKLRAKSVVDKSKAEYEHRALQPNSKVGDDLLFYIDNKREGEVKDEEMVDSVEAALKAAVRTMKFTANDETRKRKEDRKGGEKSKVKFLKYHLYDDSVKEKVLPSHDDDTSSDSSDEDMKE